MSYVLGNILYIMTKCLRIDILNALSSHRTTESNTLVGYITLAMDSNRGTLELNSLYPRFPVKAQLILFRLHV